MMFVSKEFQQVMYHGYGIKSTVNIHTLKTDLQICVKQLQKRHIQFKATTK